MKEEDLIIGIDLGTTHSLVGVVESGFPLVLADEQGKRLTPSAVFFPTRDSSSGEVPPPAPLTGAEALRSCALAPGRVITSVKRLMGRPFSDITPEERLDSPYLIESDPQGRVVIRLDEKTTVTPVEISARILAHLKRVAENALETTATRAVITVPAYFNHSQRDATKAAATLAGLTVERIINEPTAAALAYGLERLDDSQTVAVYDLGGGTFDLSVLQMREGHFEVIATAGDTRLGGDDFDQALAEEIRSELKLGELTPSESASLRSAAREAKENLSESEQYIVRLPFFREGESFEFNLTRNRLEALIAPILERTAALCRRAFAEAAAKGAPEVDHLILVGGSTRLPLVREKLTAWFGLQPNLSQHPDEAIALGAAIQAGMLCGRVRSLVLVDVTPLSLGIETFGGLMNVIIPRNSTIPAKAGEMFTNAVTNQATMAIRVLQGEREMAKDNWLLGQIEVPFQPGLKGSARVGVQFSIDADGILEVLTRDTGAGRDLILKIHNAAVDVENDAVEKMVSESIDHAFDDMERRVWTEARLKSEELLPAVEVALAAVGEKLGEEERESISRSTARVRQILDSGMEDADALKRANAALDETTQSLAALLVEAAFSEE